MNKAKLATATAESFNAECWELAKQADGKWKLLDLAKYLFAQWQSERHHNKKKTRMNVELRAKNQNITDRNRAEAKRWERLSDRNLDLSRLQHARILELEQQLATHLVPVPNSPGMAFISYPN